MGIRTIVLTWLVASVAFAQASAQGEGELRGEWQLETATSNGFDMVRDDVPRLEIADEQFVWIIKGKRIESRFEVHGYDGDVLQLDWFNELPDGRIIRRKSIAAINGEKLHLCCNVNWEEDAARPERFETVLGDNRVCYVLGRP